MMPVKARINIKFYRFTAKFNKIHADQTHFSAGQWPVTDTYFMAWITKLNECPRILQISHPCPRVIFIRKHKELQKSGN